MSCSYLFQVARVLLLLLLLLLLLFFVFFSSSSLDEEEEEEEECGKDKDREGMWKEASVKERG